MFVLFKTFITLFSLLFRPAFAAACTGEMPMAQGPDAGTGAPFAAVPEQQDGLMPISVDPSKYGNFIVFKQGKTPSEKQNVMEIAHKLFGKNAEKFIEGNLSVPVAQAICLLLRQNRLGNSIKEMQVSKNAMELKETEEKYDWSIFAFKTANSAGQKLPALMTSIGGLDEKVKEKVKEILSNSDEINKSKYSELKIENSNLLGEYIPTFNIYCSLRDVFAKEMAQNQDWREIIKLILQDHEVTPMTGMARMMAICDTKNPLFKLPSYNSDPSKRKSFLDYKSDKSEAYNCCKKHLDISYRSLIDLQKMLSDATDRRKLTELITYILMQPGNLKKFEDTFKMNIPKDCTYAQTKEGTLTVDNAFSTLGETKTGEKKLVPLPFAEFKKKLGSSSSQLPASSAYPDPSGSANPTSEGGQTSESVKDKSQEEMQKKSEAALKDIDDMEKSLDECIQKLKDLSELLKKDNLTAGTGGTAATNGSNPAGDGSTGGTAQSGIDFSKIKSEIEKELKDIKDAVKHLEQNVSSGSAGTNSTYTSGTGNNQAQALRDFINDISNYKKDNTSNPFRASLQKAQTQISGLDTFTQIDTIQISGVDTELLDAIKWFLKIYLQGEKDIFDHTDPHINNGHSLYTKLYQSLKPSNQDNGSQDFKKSILSIIANNVRSENPNLRFNGMIYGNGQIFNALNIISGLRSYIQLPTPSQAKRILESGIKDESAPSSAPTTSTSQINSSNIQPITDAIANIKTKLKDLTGTTQPTPTSGNQSPFSSTPLDPSSIEGIIKQIENQKAGLKSLREKQKALADAAAANQAAAANHKEEKKEGEDPAAEVESEKKEEDAVVGAKDDKKKDESVVGSIKNALNKVFDTIIFTPLHALEDGIEAFGSVIKSMGSKLRDLLPF